MTDYAYRFVDPDTGQELFAFHQHPHVAGADFPHLHLGPGLGIRREFARIHVPTGAISPDDVVRFAVGDLGVRPRRRDWRAVLERIRQERVQVSG